MANESNGDFRPLLIGEFFRANLFLFAISLSREKNQFAGYTHGPEKSN